MPTIDVFGNDMAIDELMRQFPNSLEKYKNFLDTKNPKWMMYQDFSPLNSTGNLARNPVIQSLKMPTYIVGEDLYSFLMRSMRRKQGGIDYCRYKWNPYVANPDTFSSFPKIEFTRPNYYNDIHQENDKTSVNAG